MPRSRFVVFAALAPLVAAACSSHSHGAATVPVVTSDAGVGTSSCGTWGSGPASAQVLGDALPRAMGASVRSSCGTSGTSSASSLHLASIDAGAVAGTGDVLYLPVLPLLSMDGSSFVTPPKIVKIDSGVVSDFYVFPDAEVADYASHFFAQTTIDGNTGVVSRGDAVSVAVDASGNVYYSNSLVSKIYRFDSAGNRSDFASGLPQVLSLSIGPDGSLYAATGAFFNGPALSKPPEIMKLDASGNATAIATLPTTYSYDTGFFGPTGAPIGLMIDLAFDGAANMYVAINMAGVVLEFPNAPTDGGLPASPTEIATDIDAPSGIVAASDGRLLVAQAPVFSTSGAEATIPEVLAIATDGTKSVFYEGSADPAYDTHFFSRPNAHGAYPVDAVFKLASDAKGNVFYEDSLVNRITLLAK